MVEFPVGSRNFQSLFSLSSSKSLDELVELIDNTPSDKRELYKIAVNILNSISSLKMQHLDISAIQPFAGDVENSASDPRIILARCNWLLQNGSLWKSELDSLNSFKELIYITRELIVSAGKNLSIDYTTELHRRLILTVVSDSNEKEKSIDFFKEWAMLAKPSENENELQKKLPIVTREIEILTHGLQRMVRSSQELIHDSLEISGNLRNSASTNSYALGALNLLATRMFHDIAGVAQLVSAKLDTQAFALDAAIYEMAHLMGYIGDNELRGRKWLEMEEDKPFASIKEMLSGYILNRYQLVADENKKIVNEWYVEYKFLCTHKHANAKQQVFDLLRPEGGKFIYMLKPRDGYSSAWASFKALYLGLYYTIEIGLGFLIHFHLKDENLIEKHNRIRESLFWYNKTLWEIESKAKIPTNKI